MKVTYTGLPAGILLGLSRSGRITRDSSCPDSYYPCVASTSPTGGWGGLWLLASDRDAGRDSVCFPNLTAFLGGCSGPGLQVFISPQTGNRATKINQKKPTKKLIQSCRQSHRNRSLFQNKFNLTLVAYSSEYRRIFSLTQLPRSSLLKQASVSSA